MTKSYIIIGVLLLISIIIFNVIPSGVVVYNTIITLNNTVTMYKSNIDVVYKKQYNLVDNAVEIAKSYAKFEESTLEKTVKARYNSSPGTSEAMLKLLVVIEKYPDLKTHEQFMNLSNQITSLETEIQTSKYKYNDAVFNYTTFTNKFPNSIIFKMFKFNTYSLYTLPENVERDSKIKINLK